MPLLITVHEMRLQLWIILLCCCFGALGLKCRSKDGGNDEEFKRIVRSCMQRSGSGGGGGNQDESDNRRFNYDQDYRQGSGKGDSDRERDRDRDRDRQQTYGNRWQRSPKNAENNTSEYSSCVPQCFFEQLNMVDAHGQPDRRKVSYMLTKDLRDRALRNFYMDTVQQCFRYLEQSRYQNKCGQSRELVRCMAEYAKAQCDDWDEYSNVLFT